MLTEMKTRVNLASRIVPAR